MADKQAPSSQPAPNLNPANPSPTRSDQPFTPRSSTFPDFDSDSDIDTHDPTPVSSPGGPQYDDLPPSYDEAQQEALEHARAGIPPIDPNNLEVHRLALSADATNSSSPPPLQRVHHSHLDNLGNYELEPENQRNARGLGMNIPVTQVRSSEYIPVGRTANQPTSLIYALLEQALVFTKHEADADARFAPRLARCVAIPQSQISTKERHHSQQHRHRRGKDRGRSEPPAKFPPWARSIPGKWPGSKEGDNTHTSSIKFFSTDTVQFLRSYAKSLHSHSIRPAEFADFIDGLNVLCSATNTTASDLLHSSPDQDAPSSLVRNYINSANESFFAPRGLRVSIQSLATLLSSLQIPEDMGQRATALASALDLQAGIEQRAQALYPWTEKLETDVPGQSAKIAVLGEIGESLRRNSHSSAPSYPVETSTNDPRDREKGRLAEPEVPDPEHSIPGSSPIPGSAHRGCNNGRNRGWGPGVRPNIGQFSWNSRMRPPGPPFMPFHGGWGPGNHRDWGGHHGRPWPRASPSGHDSANRGQPDSWAAWGESIAKLGEEFGKRMEAWGGDFGRRAEEWGADIGHRAEVFGEQVERRATRSCTQHNSQDDIPEENSAATYALARDTSRPAGQETGILPGDGELCPDSRRYGPSSEMDIQRDDDDDETSSLSSFSSSSSSSDDDNDEPVYPDTQATFLARIHEINNAAEVATKKGKKHPAIIARERDAAIVKAQSEKSLRDLKSEHKRTKTAIKKDLRMQKKALRKQHKQLRKKLMDSRNGSTGSKEKLDKREKRHLKHEWRNKKREHRDLKREARREWREEREKWRKMKSSWKGEEKEWESLEDLEHNMAWVVIENLAM